MNRAEQAVRTLDRVQQRHGWLAFLVAVWKKFSDDQAGNLAALVAYYGFASLFPLLLVFVTVLDIVLRGDRRAAPRPTGRRARSLRGRAGSARARRCCARSRRDRRAPARASG